jgi:probable rRNA maturation factor
VTGPTKSRAKQVRRVAKQAPQVSVHNRQRSVSVDLAALQHAADQMVDRVLALSVNGTTRLHELSEVSATLVSDARMATVHRRFLNQPGPTDVITFDHGEIVISVDTARRNARRFGSSLVRELQLYFIHGLLHLHGFDDATARDAGRMARVQERILRQVTR